MASSLSNVSVSNQRYETCFCFANLSYKTTNPQESPTSRFNFYFAKYSEKDIETQDKIQRVSELTQLDVDMDKLVKEEISRIDVET